MPQFKWHSPGCPCCDGCNPYVPCCLESIGFATGAVTTQIGGVGDTSEFIVTDFSIRVRQDCLLPTPNYTQSVNFASTDMLRSGGPLPAEDTFGVGGGNWRRNSFGVPIPISTLWCECSDGGVIWPNFSARMKVTRKNNVDTPLDLVLMSLSFNPVTTGGACYLKFLGASDSGGANAWDVSGAKQDINSINETAAISGISYQGPQGIESNELVVDFGVPLFACNRRCYDPALDLGRNVLERSGEPSVPPGHPNLAQVCWVSMPCLPPSAAISNDPNLNDRHDDCDGTGDMTNPCLPCDCWERPNNNINPCENQGDANFPCAEVDCTCQSCGLDMVNNPIGELMRVPHGGTATSGSMTAKLMGPSWTGTWWHFVNSDLDVTSEISFPGNGFLWQLRGKLVGGDEKTEGFTTIVPQLELIPENDCPAFSFQWNWNAANEQMEFDVTIDGNPYFNKWDVPTGWTPDPGTGTSYAGTFNKQVGTSSKPGGDGAQLCVTG